MSPSKEDSHPLIYTYLKKYQEDPGSRVFAPLAEAYRKAGFIDEAIEIAREGLRVHPGFIGGRVALARALFDKHYYAEVIRELTPVVQDVPDNLVAQRLLAESFLMLGRLAEALDAFKMLLYFAPQDPDTAKMVRELEVQAYEKGTLVLTSDTSTGNVHPSDLDPPRHRWIRKIEALQGLLQRVERYKTLNSLRK
jgi:tetratricopeptide (TPR) repeat protein